MNFFSKVRRGFFGEKEGGFLAGDFSRRAGKDPIFGFYGPGRRAVKI